MIEGVAVYLGSNLFSKEIKFYTLVNTSISHKILVFMNVNMYILGEPVLHTRIQRPTAVYSLHRIQGFNEKVYIVYVYSLFLISLEIGIDKRWKNINNVVQKMNFFIHEFRSHTSAAKANKIFMKNRTFEGRNLTDYYHLCLI